MESTVSLVFDSVGANLHTSTDCFLCGGVAVATYRARGKRCLLQLDGPETVPGPGGLMGTWIWQPAGEGLEVRLELENTGATELVLDALDVLAVRASGGGMLDLGTRPEDWSVYQNGWTSSSPALARHVRDSYYTDPGTPEYRWEHFPHWDGATPGDLTSEWVTVISPGSAPSLLLGFVTTRDQLAEIRLSFSDTTLAALIARCHLDDVVLRPGERRHSEQLWICYGDDPLLLLEAWSARTGEVMQARVPPSMPTGWSGRYYYFGASSPGDIRDNVEAMRRHSLPLGTVLIDEGYQAAIGDWLTPRAEYSVNGLTDLVAEIHAAGYRAGIWTAPFGLSADSKAYQQHPDWVLRGSAGEPVSAWIEDDVDCYALDCTRRDVLSWLRETFGVMRRDWGIDFFIVDHVTAAARAGWHHDPGVTRAGAVRLGLEAIRAAIGEDAFLLASGAPLGPCIGLVDAMRTGPDADPNWYPIWSHDLSLPSAGNALRNSLVRASFQNRLWANDPDCVLIRRRGQESELVLNEMRTQAALTGLCGGVTFDSDHLGAIRPGRLKYLRQILPPAGVAARPVDLFRNEMPHLFQLSIDRAWGHWWVVGVINWEDRTVETTVSLAEMGLPAGAYHVYHYWRRRYLGMTTDTLTVQRHQPHETAVLLFKPVAAHPDLLTTTFHVCQGAVEVEACEWLEADRTLSIRLRKQGRQFGRVLYALPGGWSVLETRVNGRKRSAVEVAPGIVALGLTLSGHAVIDATFGQSA